MVLIAGDIPDCSLDAIGSKIGIGIFRVCPWFSTGETEREEFVAKEGDFADCH